MARSSSVVRNVLLKTHRTSIRLEPELWDALAEIAHLENISSGELCDRVCESLPKGQIFSSGIRVFVMSYYRNRINVDLRKQGEFKIACHKCGHSSSIIISLAHEPAA